MNKTYAYYPGCSVEAIAASYHVSTMEVAHKLGIELAEIDDWNCCGATAYAHVDELLANVLSARNLALAETEGRADLVAPCSACFKNLYFANEHMLNDADLMEHMNYALEEDDLHYSGTVNVHHLLEFFVNEVGLDAIREKATDRLEGLRIAPYYGCQIVRPRKKGQVMADIEAPHFFEDLVEAIGADVADFTHRLQCCGASLVITNRKAALAMLREILESAVAAEADVIATACPLCQVNLEVYQSEVNHEYNTDFQMPVVYFTQLMGLAFGSKPKKVALGKEVVPVAKGLARKSE